MEFNGFSHFISTYPEEYKEKVLVDSNVWIGSLWQPDSMYEKARSLLERVSNLYVVYVHDLIILETLTVLRNKKVPHLSEIYEKFLEEDYAYIDNTPLNLGVSKPLFERFPKLSIVDAFLLYLCWDKNYALLTLDKNLLKAAKELKIKVIDSV